MSRKSRRNDVPEWLWFFIALPVSLITVLLMRNRGKLRSIVPAVTRKPQYVEPDSIPLDMDDVRLPSNQPAMAQRSALIEEEPRAPESEAPPEDQLDDLKIIEGIGPSIAGLLRENGIRTYHALATTPVERLVEILEKAKLKHLADPTTWSEQARMAADDQWEALDEYQKTLKGGRKVQ